MAVAGANQAGDLAYDLKLEVLLAHAQKRKFMGKLLAHSSVLLHHVAYTSSMRLNIPSLDLFLGSHPHTLSSALSDWYWAGDSRKGFGLLS